MSPPPDSAARQTILPPHLQLIEVLVKGFSYMSSLQAGDLVSHDLAFKIYSKLVEFSSTVVHGVKCI